LETSSVLPYQQIVDGQLRNNDEAHEMTTTQIYYFAYGSNLNHEQMRLRCPGATLIDRAHLNGYSLGFDAKGYATLAQYPKFVVHGVVWRLDEAAELALDRYEGVASHCYGKVSVMVTMESGEQVQALTYISMRPLGGSCDVTPDYAHRILQGLQDCKIHRAYNEYIMNQLLPTIHDLKDLMAHLSGPELGALCCRREALAKLRSQYKQAELFETDAIIMAAKDEFSHRERRLSN
jgi:gamma-glutamylcyclotransferase (GGCT)/AIG2-like uncharacterized protein YtfP